MWGAHASGCEGGRRRRHSLPLFPAHRRAARACPPACALVSGRHGPPAPPVRRPVQTGPRVPNASGRAARQLKVGEKNVQVRSVAGDRGRDPKPGGGRQHAPGTPPPSAEADALGAVFSGWKWFAGSIAVCTGLQGTPAGRPRLQRASTGGATPPRAPGVQVSSCGSAMRMPEGRSVTPDLLPPPPPAAAAASLPPPQVNSPCGRPAPSCCSCC